MPTATLARKPKPKPFQPRLSVRQRRDARQLIQFMLKVSKAHLAGKFGRKRMPQKKPTKR